MHHPHSTITCETTVAEGEKEGWKIKEGELDSVATATLIDILQVEQLSRGLTTAS